MIIGTLDNIETFRTLNPLIYKALQWATEHVGDPFAKGTQWIEEDKVKVNSEEVVMLPRERRQLEAHRRWADIHIPLSNDERIGWAPTETLRNLTEPYDDEKDIAFYGDSAQAVINIRKKQFAIFFPEDAHAPNIGVGNHRKLCIKIRLQENG